MPKTSDLNVKKIIPLKTPAAYFRELPADESIQRFVMNARRQISDILSGEDSRLLCIVGPCSIHDDKAGLEYAFKLAELSRHLRHRLFIVMRAYFEKPRTANDWKGIISQPGLNNDFDIEIGLHRARKFLLEMAKIGLPAAIEALDPLTPQYLADLISWAAIGARTTESQTHRQMASGLSMPVGFKNNTAGDIQVAINAIVTAKSHQSFLGIDHRGRAAIVSTKGNQDCHLVLRGGDSGSNYDSYSVGIAISELQSAGLRPVLMVDCSHGNSQKDIGRQVAVFHDVLVQRASGNQNIIGVMLESNLFFGSQKLNGNGLHGLKYGVSVTDPCIGWDQTVELLEEANRSLGFI